MDEVARFLARGGSNHSNPSIIGKFGGKAAVVVVVAVVAVVAVVFVVVVEVTGPS